MAWVKLQLRIGCSQRERVERDALAAGDHHVVELHLPAAAGGRHAALQLSLIHI